MTAAASCPPAGAWRIPLASGAVALLERDNNGAKRMIVTTILEADMTGADSQFCKPTDKPHDH